MSPDTPFGPSPASFRGRYERARRLDYAGQLVECTDYLENPEILAFEFLQAFSAVESCCGPTDFSFKPDADPAELVLEPYSEGMMLHLLCDDGIAAFTCVAGGLDPVPPEDTESPRGGLDYLGLTEDVPEALVFGATESPLERGPYLALLRLLNCFAELAPAVQVERLNRELFEGRLPVETLVDLHLVINDRGDDPDRRALGELSRDLAEQLKARLGGAWQFPHRLRDVYCLDSDPSASDGTLRVLWKV